jgi:ubiquinol-cytochrome c reductase cytochrome b subunit
LMLLPFIHNSEIRSHAFRPRSRKFYWVFIACFRILGWIGQNEVAYPFVEVGQVASVYYFSYLLIIIPGLGYRESKLMRAKPL